MSAPQKPSVLIIDDEPDICSAMSGMLASDYLVETLSSPMEALPLLAHSHFDVILIDYSMPEIRGDGLVSIIRLRQPTQPIILMTAYPDMLECVNHPLPQLGAILRKPFRAGELRGTIERVRAAHAVLFGTPRAPVADATPAADSPPQPSQSNPR